MASLTEEILGMRPNVAHEYFGFVPMHIWVSRADGMTQDGERESWDVAGWAWDNFVL